MDERFSADDTDPHKSAFSPAELREKMNGEQWQNLTPNNHSPEHDLLPQEIQPEQIEAVVGAIIGDPYLGDFQVGFKEAGELARDAFKTKDLGPAGRLDFVDHGEAKICYSLTRDGRKMAVVLQSYDQKAIDIPEGPRLTRVNTTLKEDVLEYSDLRTYGMFPVAGGKAVVKLQEFGERPARGFGNAAMGGLKGYRCSACSRQLHT